MCRMAAYVGNSREEMVGLYRSLKATVRSEAESKGVRKAEQCMDGWGYVVASDCGIVHYRTGRSILDDRISLPNTEGMTYAIFHARKATDKSTVSWEFSHPFAGRVGSGQIYLAHNGQIKFNARDGCTMDTQYGLEVIEREGVERGVEKLKGIVKTGLNLLILEADAGPRLRFLNFYLDRTKSGYFDMFYRKTDSGIVVVSSTLRQNGIKTASRVPYGELMDMDSL